MLVRIWRHKNANTGSSIIQHIVQGWWRFADKGHQGWGSILLFSSMNGKQKQVRIVPTPAGEPLMRTYCLLLQQRECTQDEDS